MKREIWVAIWKEILYIGVLRWAFYPESTKAEEKKHSSPQWAGNKKKIRRILYGILPDLGLEPWTEENEINCSSNWRRWNYVEVVAADDEGCIRGRLCETWSGEKWIFFGERDPVMDGTIGEEDRGMGHCDHRYTDAGVDGLKYVISYTETCRKPRWSILTIFQILLYWAENH